MKTTIAATVAVATCASTQLFAQNIKDDTITMALTALQQPSVSTSTRVANAGNFSQGSTHYKTTSFKMTDKDIIKAISYVMQHFNANSYWSGTTSKLRQTAFSGLIVNRFDIGINKDDYLNIAPLNLVPLNHDFTCGGGLIYPTERDSITSASDYGFQIRTAPVAEREANADYSIFVE